LRRGNSGFVLGSVWLFLALRWRPRFASGLLALPLCGATLEPPVTKRGCQRKKQTANPSKKTKTKKSPLARATFYQETNNKKTHITL
jgi:hypothetical protein